MFLAKIFIFIACCCILFGSSKGVTVECEYGYDGNLIIGSLYTCDVKNKLNINFRDAAVIVNATGTHLSEQNDKNVTLFLAHNKKIEYMPRGLDQIFENLKGISISSGRIKEIHQKDLKQYVKLEYLSLRWNDIEILEDGLFDYNPELRMIIFFGNKIIQIGEHVFDKLRKLYWLDLLENECIDKVAFSDTEVMKVINKTKNQCKYNESLTVNKI